MLILGIVFTIWGLVLCKTGIENRSHLKHIYDENVDVMHLKQGEYVSITEMQLLGEIREDKFYIFESGWGGTWYFCVNINAKTHDYIGIEGTNKRFGKHIDSLGLWNSKRLRDGTIAKDPIEFIAKVVKMNEDNQYSHDFIMSHAKSKWIQISDAKWQVNNHFFLQQVNVKEEQAVLWAGICVLLAGILLIYGSNPKTIIEKQEIVYQEREYNLLFKDKEVVDERDVRYLQEVAKELRVEVQWYKNRYQRLQQEVKYSAIACGISLLVAGMIPILVAPQLLAILYFFYTLFNLLLLKLNADSQFAANCLSAFSREPLLRVLNDRKAKLEKCEAILKENFER